MSLEGDTVELRRPSRYLTRSALFSGLPPDILDAFDEDATWVRLACGEVLFRQGDAPDGLYVVIQGGVDVLTSSGGPHRLVEELGVGAVVGEMAIITDAPRSATLRARRDTRLVRVSRDGFLRVLNAYPRLGIELARLLANRLRATTASGGRSTRQVRTIALLPLRRNGVPRGFGQQLADALARPGQTTALVTRQVVEAALGVS